MREIWLIEKKTLQIKEDLGIQRDIFTSNFTYIQKKPKSPDRRGPVSKINHFMKYLTYRQKPNSVDQSEPGNNTNHFHVLFDLLKRTQAILIKVELGVILIIFMGSLTFRLNPNTPNQSWVVKNTNHFHELFDL